MELEFARLRRLIRFKKFYVPGLNHRPWHPRYYRKKVIVSGDVLEVYTYQKGVKINSPPKKTSHVKKEKIPRGDMWEETDQAELDFIENGRRARNKLRRLINSNVNVYIDKNLRIIPSVFLTLTFAENIQDMTAANHLFKLFLYRLNDRVTGERRKRFLKYVVVTEFQKRGAIHYHVIFFNLPYIPVVELNKIWGHGWLEIKAIDNCDNVGAYISKYMGKYYDDERLEGKKKYFCSQGLVKPSTYIETKKIASLEASLSEANLVFNKTYHTQYMGVCTYRQYNKKRNGGL